MQSAELSCFSDSYELVTSASVKKMPESVPGDSMSEVLVRLIAFIWQKIWLRCRILLAVYITLGEAYNAQKKFTDAELSFQKAEKILLEHKKSSAKTRDSGDDEMDRLRPSLRIAQAKYVQWPVGSSHSTIYIAN